MGVSDSRIRSWIDNYFHAGTAKQDIDPIQNITPKDAFAPRKVCLESARILLSVKPGPYLKRERGRRAACNTSDQALYALARIELKELAIRPRQDARVRSGIGNDPIEDEPRRATCRAELHANQWQGFSDITGVITKGNAANVARLFFPADADEERMQSSRLGRVKHGNGTAARGDHLSISKADPLAGVLIEELMADSPVRRFILTAVGMDLPRDLRRQAVGDTLHGRSQKGSRSSSMFDVTRRLIMDGRVPLANRGRRLGGSPSKRMGWGKELLTG
jgi:hypothetical protein